MGKSIQWLSLVLTLAIGLLLLYFNKQISEFFILPADSSLALSTHQYAGNILISEGDVYLIEPGFHDPYLVSGGEDLFSQHTLDIRNQSKAQISFKSGAILQFYENSLIGIEVNMAGQVLMTLHRGQFKVIKPGIPNSIKIQKNKEWSSLESFTEQQPVLIAINSNDAINTNDKDTQNEEELQTGLETSKFNDSLKKNEPILEQKPITSTSTSITIPQIQTQIKNQELLLRKCFISLLTKNPQSKGDALIRFKINPSGDVAESRSEILTLNDEEFEKCILEVFKRVRFTPFKGYPILAHFPLKFY